MIVFCHGFWVQKDARGLFSDLVWAIDSEQCHLFDYNHLSQEGLVVAPFSVQSKILAGEIRHIREKQHSDPIDLICHSQWFIAPLLLEDVSMIRSAIFLAPPLTLDPARIRARAEKRPGSQFYENGDVKSIVRSDGSRTIIPEEYYEELRSINLPEKYRQFLSRIPTIIIFGDSDRIVGDADVFSVDYISWTKTIVTIPGDHDFKGNARVWLIEAVLSWLRELKVV